MGYNFCSQRLATLASNECLAGEKQTLRSRRKHFVANLFIYLFIFNGFPIAVREKFRHRECLAGSFLAPKKNQVFLKLKICSEISENYHLTQKRPATCSRSRTKFKKMKKRRKE